MVLGMNTCKSVVFILLRLGFGARYKYFKSVVFILLRLGFGSRYEYVKSVGSAICSVWRMWE